MKNPIKLHLPAGLFKALSIMMLCLMTMSCSAQKTLSDVTSIKGVKSVYVGKTMLQLAQSLTTVNIGDADDAIDIGKLMGKLTSIEIITCDEKKAVEKAAPLAQKILSQYPFEIITEVTDDDQRIEISGVFNESGDVINMLLIKVYEKKEDLTLILLKGEIDLATLQTALKHSC